MRIPLLLVGKDGTTSVHGKKQSMATKALKALRRAESEGRLMICWVNESFTLKVIKNPFIFLQSIFIYMRQSRYAGFAMNKQTSQRKFQIHLLEAQCPCGMCWNVQAVNTTGIGILMLPRISSILVFVNMMVHTDLKYFHNEWMIHLFLMLVWWEYYSTLSTKA
jgi:uncharacterized membrane protein